MEKQRMGCADHLGLYPSFSKRDAYEWRQALPNFMCLFSQIGSTPLYFLTAILLLHWFEDY
jgi:hypothetical protein